MKKLRIRPKKTIFPPGISQDAAVRNPIARKSTVNAFRWESYAIPRNVSAAIAKTQRKKLNGECKMMTFSMNSPISSSDLTISDLCPFIF